MLGPGSEGTLGLGGLQPPHLLALGLHAVLWPETQTQHIQLPFTSQIGPLPQAGWDHTVLPPAGTSATSHLPRAPGRTGLDHQSDPTTLAGSPVPSGKSPDSSSLLRPSGPAYLPRAHQTSRSHALITCNSLTHTLTRSHSCTVTHASAHSFTHWCLPAHSHSYSHTCTHTHSSHTVSSSSTQACSSLLALVPLLPLQECPPWSPPTP